MPLETLFLDLGNVLVFHDNEKLFREMARAFRATPERLRRGLDDRLWERVNRGQLPGDRLRQELVRQVGVEVGEEEFFALWNCHFTVHEEMVRAVERLVGKVRLVLLSNTHDLHVKWIRPRLPVLERFDALVLSCEEGLVKPEPALYARALAVAGSAPQASAFFDDVEAYAAGARAAGIHGHLFTTVDRFLEDLRALGLSA